MATEPEPRQADPTPDRWTLLRDVLVLQVKLVVDGLRDLILVPVSLVVGIVSLLAARRDDKSGNEFYELLRIGRRTERWIDLFGAAERVYGPQVAGERFPAESIDEIVQRVESFVVAEYRRGGVTRQAKDRLDQALDSLHKLASTTETRSMDDD